MYPLWSDRRAGTLNEVEPASEHDDTVKEKRKRGVRFSCPFNINVKDRALHLVILIIGERGR